MNHLEQEQCLAESLKELECVNKKLSKLVDRKKELTDLIIGAFEHEHAGQKTYEYDKWKVVVKTPYKYELNKEAYEALDFQFPKKFNPIKKSVIYKVDKRMCDLCISEAPNEVKEALDLIITQVPASKSIDLIRGF